MFRSATTSHPFLTDPRGALLSRRKKFSPCLFRRVGSFFRATDRRQRKRCKVETADIFFRQSTILHGYEKEEYLKKENVKKKEKFK